VSDKVHPVQAKPIEQAQDVGDEEWPAIGVDIGWSGRIAKAAKSG
jgi:hypothetical protein